VAAYTRGLAEDAPAKEATPAAPGTGSSPAGAAAPAPQKAASAEPPAPPPAPRKPTLLKQSLLASKTWLRDEPENNFCVQIENFPASEPARAEKFLADTRAAMGLNEVHTYPMLINGERRIAIVYGSFASAKKVLEVQATLAERSGTHHKIRTIKGIRQAIAKAESKKQASSTS
jgi:septal ring-binding cell division protein DamX